MLLLALLPPADARAAEVPVRIETNRGVIDAALALAAAPISVCNALRYIIGGHYDGGRFFRSVRSDRGDGSAPPIDVIQIEARAGEEHDAFGPIPLERTSVTGLRHRAGALSMARWGPDSATSSFSIVAKASPSMDFAGPRNRDGQGFAVFGHVTRGMAVVRAIHRASADGERLRPPVRVRRIAVRRAGPAVVAAVREQCALAIGRDRGGIAGK